MLILWFKKLKIDTVASDSLNLVPDICIFSCNNETKYPNIFSRVKWKKKRTKKEKQKEFRIPNSASTNLIAC